MNIFNRMVTILLLSALAVLLIVFAVMPAHLMRVLEVNFRLLGDLLEDSGITYFSFTWNWIVTIAVALVLFDFVLLLLYLEVRRPARRAARLAGVTAGQVEVSIGSIAERLEHEVSELAEVTQVRSRIRGRGKGVEVRLDVQTRPGVEIPVKAEEICALAKEIVEERMGVQLDREVQVRIRHAPYTRHRPEPRPTSPPQPLPAIHALAQPAQPAEHEGPEQAGADS